MFLKNTKKSQNWHWDSCRPLLFTTRCSRTGGLCSYNWSGISAATIYHSVPPHGFIFFFFSSFSWGCPHFAEPNSSYPTAGSIQGVDLPPSTPKSSASKNGLQTKQYFGGDNLEECHRSQVTSWDPSAMRKLDAGRGFARVLQVKFCMYNM